MQCRILAVCLAGLVLLSPASALPVPPPSLSGVWLSDAEAAEMEAAIAEADKALQASSDKIARQEKDLKKLWLVCALLGGALAVDAVAHLVIAIKD
jgi:hypothetical protein